MLYCPVKHERACTDYLRPYDPLLGGCKFQTPPTFARLMTFRVTAIISLGPCQALSEVRMGVTWS
jgi:hypothetical protein